MEKKKSLTDRIDKLLVNIHQKAAQKYVNYTNKTKSQLEKELYLGSATLCFTAAVTVNYVMFFPAFGSTIDGFFEATRPQNQIKLKGYDQRKGMRVIMTGLSTLISTYGITETVAGIINKDLDLVQSGVQMLGISVPWLSYLSADYVSKSDIKEVKEEEPKLKDMFRYK